MSTAPSQRLEEIFLRAVELSSSERAAFLDRACQGDPSLRAELDDLLKHHSGVGGFLDSKAAPGRGLLTQLGASALSEAEPLLPVDKKIGNFNILGVLGSGGMGVVYVAQQDRPRRTVALKVMRRVLGDPNSASAQRILRRFEHEAELLGRLHHPGIAQIYEAGTYSAGGLTHPYIAMELIKGEPLLAYAGRHNLGTREKLVLVERICEAVQHAHRNGVIHRDLKPANILVDESGRPKILDFGVARTTNNDLQLTSEHTAVGALIGTLPYMSPEQVSGDPAAVDTRSDVYAVGVITYELLTGKLPYDLQSRSLPEAARIIRDEEPTRLSTIDRYFRGDVEMIVAKSLEKDRTRRYQSASDLGDDIARYLSGQPIAARRDSAMYVLRKQLRRYRGVVTTAAFALLLLLSLGVFAAIQAVRASRFAMTEQAAKTEALANLKVAETERKRANDNAANLSEQLARANVERGRLLGLSGNLQAAEDLIWPSHLRNPNSRHTFFALWELYMHEPCLGSFKANPSTLWGLASSRDGSRAIAAGEEQPILTVLDVPGQRIDKQLPLPPVRARAITMSPQGKFGAIGFEDGLLLVLDLDTGKESRRVSYGKHIIRDAAFTADGAAVLSALDDGRIMSSAPEGDTPPVELCKTDQSVWRIATSPKGDLFATGHRDGSLRIWSVDGRAIRSLKAHANDISAVTFSDDGTLLGTGALDRLVNVWDTASGEHLARLDSPNGTPRGILFANDGHRLFVAGWWTINVWNWKKEELLRRLSLPQSGVGGFFSSNGEEVWVGVGNALRGWNTDFEPAVKKLEGHSGRTMATWSPDGKWAVTGDATGAIRIWDAETNELIRTLQAGTQRIRALRFDGTSRFLVVGGEGTRAYVFDLSSQNPEPVQTLEGIHALSPRSIAFSPDNGTLVLPSTDASHRILKVPSFEVAGKIPSANQEESLGARFSPDGTMLATSDRDRAVRLWKWPSLEPIGSMRPDTINPQPWSFEFLPDSKEILISGWNRNIELWDIASLKRKQIFPGHGALVTDLAVRLREPMIFASASVDGTMKLWNREHTNEPVMLTIDTFGGYEVNTVEWSPSGRKLLIGDSLGNAQIWNMRYFNRHMGGNMQYQLDRHRQNLPSDIPEDDIREQMRILKDRSRTGA
ncbi:MAG: protein kinase [Phycisphaerales bacterium]